MGLVLVTGASGFLGSALIPSLVNMGVPVRAAHRSEPACARSSNECVRVEPLGGATDWRGALAGVSSVVHLAGPAHARFSEDALLEQIPVATGSLLRQAEEAGVRRFVFVSSIKAVCARTGAEAACEDMEPRPNDAYGRAKLEAERLVCERAALNPIILRPPLVVAANAKANFARLMRLVASGVPLPLANIDNKRSFLSLDSFTEAVCSVLRQATCPTGIYHIADRPALSTSSVVRALCEGMNRRAATFRAPPALLPNNLTESLEVDDSRFRGIFGDSWSRDARLAVAACGRAYAARSR